MGVTVQGFKVPTVGFTNINQMKSDFFIGLRFVKPTVRQMDDQ